MKLFRILLFAALAVASVVSTSCKKDDDEDWNEYKDTHSSLDFEGSYVVFPKDEFSQYHHDLDWVGFYVKYQTIENVTRYKADTTCYINFDVTVDSVSEMNCQNEINAQYEALNYNYYDDVKQGQLENIKLASVDESVTRMTYYETDRPYKCVYYFVKNSKDGRLFRISVVAPTDLTKFWNTADEILSTFKFK